MSGTRWVLVDDKDLGISYTGGPWFESSEGADSGNWGTPWRGSQHGTNATASFSYKFTGTRIRILGRSAVQRINGRIDPSWNCIVGSKDISPNDPWNAPINNWPLCESPTYTPGEHTLTVNTATTEGTTFWFDQIRYLPLPNMTSTLRDATVVVEHTDADIKFVSGNWQPLTASAIITLQAGSVMTAKFTGTKLTWVAWTPAGYPTGTSQASYSIDNGPATTFDIRGLPANSAALYNQHLFETPDLPPGEHTLTVTHNGPSAPLTLDHLLIANGDITLPGGSGTGAEGSPDASSAAGRTNDGSKEGPPVAAIGGGVGGGVVLIILGVLIYILLRRRAKRKEALRRITLDGSTMFPPPIAQVTPFMYDANNQSTYASSQTYLPASSQYPAGWTPSLASNGTQAYPAVSPFDDAPAPYAPVRRADQKNRGGPTSNRPAIPLHNMGATYPPAPFSDTSSSSRSGGNHTHSRRGSAKSTSGPSSTAHSATQLVHHEDSGIRLTDPDQDVPPPRIVDVPPLYTPS